MNLTVDHVHLRCRDVEASLDWWVRVMGGRVAGQALGAGVPITKLEVGGLTLALSPLRPGVEITSPEAEPHWGVYQIGFEVENVPRAMAEYTARGAWFRAGPLARPGNRAVAFITGPDGVEIELMGPV